MGRDEQCERRVPERQPLNGTCLSGPNGVGKSSVLHMLASVAHVNNWIVLYIVSFCVQVTLQKNNAFFFVITAEVGRMDHKTGRG